MDKKTKQAIFKAIDETDIPEEMKLMYLFASATQSLVQHVRARVGAVYFNHGFECKENDLLSGLYDYCKNVNVASAMFYDRVNPQIENATWGVGMDDDGNGNVIAYDGFHAKDNELIRLAMNYMNCENAKEAYEKTFTLLRRMSTNRCFENKAISHFKTKI